MLATETPPYSAPKKIHLDNIYFKQLDGLRCIAVMSVLICHWVRYHFVMLIPFGSMGVNLFFVISGFLITRILLISKDENGDRSMASPMKKFYIRRTLRIFPIYYLTIFFLFLVNFPAIRENVAWLLTYTFNIKLSFQGVWEMDKMHHLLHLWSLSVEEHCRCAEPVYYSNYTLYPVKLHLRLYAVLPGRFWHRRSAGLLYFIQA